MAPWVRWDIDDCEIAREEGWFLGRTLYLKCEIRRLARRKRFASDKAAVRFVRKRARAGSHVHQIAVVIHDFYRKVWADMARTRLRKRPPKKIRCKTGVVR